MRAVRQGRSWQPEDVDLGTTKACWTRYVAQGITVPEHLDGVRQEIVTSWRRSQAAGVTPFAPHLRELDERDAEAAIMESQALVDVTYPYLQEFHRVLGSSTACSAPSMPRSPSPTGRASSSGASAATGSSSA